ncbi:MAG: protein-disulfide reductase DsbD [Proteobacteria bacterium]|nr:protein-disulfide reductase DsbD [Pseudomonadota bacterium]
MLPLSVYAGGLGEKLGNIFSTDSGPVSDEILDPEIAFQLSINQVSNDQLALYWQIEPGYYLYKDKFSASTTTPSVEIINAIYPQGKLKQDPLFGEVEVYYGKNNALIPVAVKDQSVKEIILELAYQGCKEDAICYPPIKKSLPVSFSFNVNETNTLSSRIDKTELLSEQDTITQKLKHKSLLINILTFFGFGFLLALTPCVFPMIPILSGIIVGEGERITRLRAILLSISYVVAMALTYAVLGVIAGLFNINLQAASQNIWVISLFSAIFVALALSMFGFYELQLPSSWQSKLTNAQTRERGTLKGAAFMGALSAIIVGPCVAPPLAGALLYISQTGNAVLGGFALFAMGLGFGVPLLVVGATSGELLPRAGVWMESIKRVFGVIMLGVAIWFLERVLPQPVILILWAALFISSAVFMGALDRIESTTTNWQKLCKGLGLVVLVYGVVLIIAAAKGNGTVLKPFTSSSFSGSVTSHEQLPFSYIANLDELTQQLDQARQENKNVMLDFYADWCVVCKEMEAYTFTDPTVRQSLSQLVLLKADVTRNNQSDKALLKHFDLFGPPAILFFNTDAVEVKSHRLVGFIKADDFVTHISQAISL